ncbi:hypothetical protein GQ607_004231 [Colletotrichum asianum]|uniref:Uncharacterized protein n=1 Tax=Colletotrichum asianum TaxID=702518 RepID=A0A8H3ZXL1_9PEZI|nr:hypothetical protein GQ607_004231 [Colletotrichum asianum]
METPRTTIRLRLRSARSGTRALRYCLRPCRQLRPSPNCPIITYRTQNRIDYRPR